MSTTAKSPLLIASAIAYTTAIVALGYVMLGLLPMLLFTLGFVTGLLLWLGLPTVASFGSLRAPFYVSFALFVVHKWEERNFDFFPALSEITGIPVPSTDSILVVALYGLIAAWLLIPFLINRRSQFGYFLAWTFFASLGIIELAHFIFPLLTDRPYGYFPGMASVVVLAPAAWWGLWRLGTTRTAGALS